MSANLGQTLKGFRDFIPSEKRKRDFIEGKIKKVFERYGFLPIETPTIESASLLLGKYGKEADKLVYTFEDNGGRRVGLKYDQTVPTTRFLANHKGKLPAYFRRYQLQNVFRAEKPQKGRYREFKQCDIDIFGAKEGVSDAEVIACTFDVYKEIGFSDIQILINDRKTLLDTIKPFVTDPVDVFSIIQTIDKLDKMSKELVVEELVKKGLSLESANRCLEAVFKTSPSDSLTNIIKLAKELGVPGPSIVFTPYLARGLDYYTGMILEVVLKGRKGSLGGGGRYNNLVKELSGQDIPAVGVGLGFDRIVEVADELGLIPDENNTSVFVTVFSNDLLDKSLEVANKLRLLNVPTEVFVGEVKGISKQLKYANKLGSRYVVVIGENEAKDNSLLIKDMESGEQKIIKLDEIKAWVKEIL